MTRMEKVPPALRANVMAECVDLRTLPSSISAMTRRLDMAFSLPSSSENLRFGLQLLDELRHALHLDAGLARGRQLEGAVGDLERGVADEIRELHLHERLLLRRHDRHQRGEADAL